MPCHLKPVGYPCNCDLTFPDDFSIGNNRRTPFLLLFLFLLLLLLLPLLLLLI